MPTTRPIPPTESASACIAIAPLIGVVRSDETGCLELESNVLRETVAESQFERLSTDSRRRLIKGVDADLLRRRNHQADIIDCRQT